VRRKTIAILQPVYLPWLGYFEQMAYADHFVFYDEVQNTRQDWRNRNRILTKDGPFWLTVPVRKTGLATPINQVGIDNSKHWKKKHLRAIYYNYKDRAHFMPLYGAIEALLSNDWIKLCDLDVALIECLCEHLAIDTEISRASDVLKDPDLYERAAKGTAECRNYSRNWRLIEICRHHGASHFYEGAKGADFIDTDLFRRHGIEVVFQEYCHPVYPQRHPGFLSHLSVLDLIMNTGPRARDILLSSPRSGTTEL